MLQNTVFTRGKQEITVVIILCIDNVAFVASDENVLKGRYYVESTFFML